MAAVRTYDAAEAEMPMPASATYAATQAGHFGISASTVPGTTHPAAPRHRPPNVRRRPNLQQSVFTGAPFSLSVTSAA